MTSIGYGLILGFIPASFMIFSSFVMMNHSVSELTEAILQNFSAGMIISAVAAELYPQLKNEATSKGVTLLGVTVGFICACILLYGIEGLIDSFNDEDEDGEDEKGSHKSSSKNSSGKISRALLHSSSQKNGYQSISSIESTLDDAGDDPEGLGGGGGEWEDESVAVAVTSIRDPTQRSKLESLLNSILSSIVTASKHTQSLGQADLTANMLNEVTGSIDKEIHNIQFILDSSRRLFQAQDFAINFSRSNSGKLTRDSRNMATQLQYLAEEKKLLFESKLQELRNRVTSMLVLVSGSTVSNTMIKRLYNEMNEVDRALDSIHESVEYRWRRSRPFPVIPVGSPIPLGMLLPIVIDGFIDGFMVGVSCSISLNAGIVLSVANSIEMSLLGMALSTRVAKCTGSSKLVRYVAISSPPCVMVLGTLLGTYLGDVSKRDPLLFTSFVSFGIVALLYLCCNELIIEAREIQKGGNLWYVSIYLFIGVYSVIAMDALLPSSS